jgi:hypothetical protein
MLLKIRDRTLEPSLAWALLRWQQYSRRPTL